MIETKEQYEQILNTPYPYLGEVDQGRHVRQTIEALRDVARAAKWTYPGGVLEGRLASALDALPEWLLDETPKTD